MRELWRSDSSRKSGSNKNKSCMFMGRYHTKLQSSVTHFLQFKSLPPVLQILSKKAKTSCFCSFWHVLVILFLRSCTGTALCNPACMVDSTSRLCFHITEAHIMNDNMQKWLEMLWICGRLLILNGKHENTHPMDLYCWWPVFVITIDKVLAISVLLTRPWRSLVLVTRALWSRGTVQLWHSAGHWLTTGPSPALLHHHWALTLPELKMPGSGGTSILQK